jgi:hypothetical protein
MESQTGAVHCIGLFIANNFRPLQLLVFRHIQRNPGISPKEVYVLAVG